MSQTVPKAWSEALRSAELFAGMDDDALEHLARQMKEVVLPADACLVKQGDSGQCLYIVVRGRFRVRMEAGNAIELPELGPGAVVGEIALLAGGQRSATVEAVVESCALQLEREDFERLLDAHPDIMTPLSDRLEKRLRRSRIARHLEQVFGTLDPDMLREVESQLQWRQLDSGQQLFQQGDRPDGAYFVMVGRVRVVVPAPGGDERVVAEVCAGQWIGEMALITGSPRSATVYAVRDTQLAWLSQKVFDALLERYPAVMRQTMRLLVTRLQQTLTGTESTTRSRMALTIVPIHAGLDITAFSRELAATLGRYGSVSVFRADDIDRQLGQRGICRAASDDPASLRLAPWLFEQEERNDFVLYIGDAEWSPWTERAVRHADLVIGVADASGPAGLTRNEQQGVAYFRKLTGRSGRSPRNPKSLMVLLQRPGLTSFPGTRKWLRERSSYVDQHYHVRRGVSGDIERLTRHLLGKAITLVLGGGGSRGYAHVGVIRVLEELGVPIDAVAGTSIGAVVAGSFAMGLRSRELLRVLRPIFDSLIDPTLPLVSIASGQNAVQGTERVVGALDIEDLMIPYFAISTNLTRSQEVVHRSGSLAFAARASGSLPGVFPPVPWKQGDLLVDGGVVNNVPVDVMQRLYPGAPIAVDVMPEVDLVASEQLPMHLSGWRVAWNLINPRRKNVGMPNILNILIRSATAASYSMRRAENATSQASLFLKPTVAEWNMLDFKAAPSIAEQGYQSTRDPLRSWWRAHRAELLGSKD